MRVRNYANTAERKQFIAGLIALALFLERNDDIPAPRWTAVMVFPEDTTETDKRREIDRIAERIGSATKESAAHHYTASREFGLVEYRAVAIPADETRGQ